MKAKLVTGSGPQEIDLTDYPELNRIWSEKVTARAKPLESVEVPNLRNEGGAFNFDTVKPIDFFRRLNR